MKSSLEAGRLTILQAKHLSAAHSPVTAAEALQLAAQTPE